MNSNALLRLQSNYQSDSDSDDGQIKADLITDSVPDISNEIKSIVNLILDTIVILEMDPKSKLSIGHNPKHSKDNKSNHNSDHNMRDITNSYNEIDISSDSSSSSWSLSSDDIHEEPERKTTKFVVKTKGELSLEDLPPIEKLTISVGVEELSQLGRVASIVDQLVIVQSFRSMPALDLDSVLFFKDGQPFGRIFDVFGPVVEPRYAVRFNDVQQIIDLKICVETPIYFAAEQKRPITAFVFAEQLRRMKGSDASWKHNNEPPEDVIDFSDDESERLQKHKSNKRSYNQRNAKFNKNQNIFSFVSK